jgi:hypothetical protein
MRPTQSKVTRCIGDHCSEEEQIYFVLPVAVGGTPSFWGAALQDERRKPKEITTSSTATGVKDAGRERFLMEKSEGI